MTGIYILDRGGILNPGRSTDTDLGRSGIFNLTGLPYHDRSVTHPARRAGYSMEPSPEGWGNEWNPAPVGAGVMNG